MYVGLWLELFSAVFRRINDGCGLEGLGNVASLDEVHVAIMERNIKTLSIVIFCLMQISSRRLLQTTSGKHNCTGVFFGVCFFLFCFGLVLCFWLEIAIKSHLNLL